MPEISRFYGIVIRIYFREELRKMWETKTLMKIPPLP